MRLFIVTAMFLACPIANAEVFKCIGTNGKTVYQSKPCQATDKGQQMDIQVDPAQEAAAKAKLEALQNEYDAKKAAQAETERRDAEFRNRAEQTNALKQSAVAQQLQVEAAQRQAAAIEKQVQQNANQPAIVYPQTVMPAGPQLMQPVTPALPTVVQPAPNPRDILR